MKNDKTYNNKRQNIEISKRNQRSTNFTSPKKENRIQINETPKKMEDLTGNNFLENTLKYLEMSNGKNNYILDTNNNYIIPGLNEELDITKKYTDAYNKSSLNYGYYSIILQRMKTRIVLRNCIKLKMNILNTCNFNSKKIIKML